MKKHTQQEKLFNFGISFLALGAFPLVWFLSQAILFRELTEIISRNMLVVIGLLVGIFQAATSINEMTLAFVPKVVLVFVAFGFLAPYILTGLTDYFDLVFETIRSIN